MLPRRILLAVLLATAAAARAQQPPIVNVTTLGPKVGETAPDFAAPDQDGRPRRLSALMGPKGALLVFYRSADW
jgi:hypothetical protein